MSDFLNRLFMALTFYKVFIKKDPRNIDQNSLEWTYFHDGQLLYRDLDESEISSTSKELHQKSTAYYDKSQNALCFIVLGATSLIIGILFIFLSLLKRVNKIIGINFASLQFVICVVTLVIGFVCIIYGLYRVFMSYKVRKILKSEINQLSKLKAKK